MYLTLLTLLRTHSPSLSTSAKTEAKATEWWLTYIRNNSALYPQTSLRKIPDIGDREKPCDIMGVCEWKWVAIEVKISKLKSIPTYERSLKKCEPHQILTLQSYLHCWGEPYLMTYHMLTNTFYIYPYIHG